MILGLFENAVGIYTDGLTESFNSEHEMLGVDGLQEIVAEASTLPLAEMKNESSIESQLGVTVMHRMTFPWYC